MLYLSLFRGVFSNFVGFSVFAAPPVLHEYLVSVELNISDVSPLNQLRTILNTTVFPIRINDSIQVSNVNITMGTEHRTHRTNTLPHQRSIFACPQMNVFVLWLEVGLPTVEGIYAKQGECAHFTHNSPLASSKLTFGVVIKVISLKKKGCNIIVRSGLRTGLTCKYTNKSPKGQYGCIN